MTIEEFIRARLDEDEQIAWRADRTRWLPEDKGVTFECDDTQSDYSGRVTADTKANMTHIARHDPARVLRQVAALRSLVAAHRTRIEQGWGYHSDEMVSADLAPLAAIWSDHPDYRPEWSPETQQ